MSAALILQAIREKHPQAAVVHEVVLNDNLWDERRGESKPQRRIDALMFESFQRTAIEIKVSPDDLARDTYAKRAPWVAVTHRFVYAMPESMFAQLDRRLGGNYDIWNCGVWTVDDHGNVRVARKAVVNRHPEPLPQQVVQALAYRAARKVVL